MKRAIIIYVLLIIAGLYGYESADIKNDHVFKDPHAQSAADPNIVLAKLLKGNDRFYKGIPVHPHQDELARMKNFRDGQKPFASILGCSDSRVPLEEIFDVGIGDIFVVRVAGNIADKSEIGSLEYAAEHLGTPLIMVLGHTKCGAVTAALQNSKVKGNILSIIDNIKPAIDSAINQSRIDKSSDTLTNAIKANIWTSIEDILKQSVLLRQFVKSGKVKIVGAIYDIESGKVTELGVHRRQEQIIRMYLR